MDGLLDDLGDPLALHARDAQVAEVLRLAHVCEQHPGASLLSSEVADRLLDRAREDVVGEHDDDAVVRGELAREAERFRDPARSFLLPVLQVVPEEAPEVVHMIGAGDEHQFVDAGSLERVDGPLNHRLVAHGEQMLVRDLGERIEPRPGPAGEDDALHGDAMLWEEWS